MLGQVEVLGFGNPGPGGVPRSWSGIVTVRSDTLVGPDELPEVSTVGVGYVQVVGRVGAEVQDQSGDRSRRRWGLRGPQG